MHEVVAWLKDNGANLVGISSVDRFDGAPRGHRPQDLVKDARAVITFGVALLDEALYWESHLADSELVSEEHRKDLLQNYVYTQVAYDMVNDLLERLALRTANDLQSRGYRSMFFPSSYGRGAWEFIEKRIPSRWGLFSQRHAAVNAGLGEFGLNNLVVTPDHGPRIRFNSVITVADLKPTPIIDDKICLGLDCSLCLDNCPGGLSLREDIDPEGIWHNTPSKTDIDKCRALSREHFCLGRCMKVCPVAQ